MSVVLVLVVVDVAVLGQGHGTIKRASGGRIARAPSVMVAVGVPAASVVGEWKCRWMGVRAYERVGWLGRLGLADVRWHSCVSVCNDACT